MTSHRPNIAVLIAVYNDQEGLDCSLASLSNQGVPFDVVVVDDGSSPPARVPDTVDGASITLLRLEDNAGLVAALNLGLNHILASGYPFIGRLDAGDRSHPERLALQYSEMLRRPTLGLLGTFANLVSRDGTPLGQMRLPTGSTRIHKAIHYRTCFVHPTVMIRAQVLRHVGLYDPAYPQGQDYDLFMRIAQHSETDNISKSLVDYEVTDRSVSSTHSRRQTLSILRTSIAHFQPLYWGSYFGIIRRALNLLLSRQHMMAIKRHFGLI